MYISSHREGERARVVLPTFCVADKALMMMRRAMSCRTAYPRACHGIEVHIAVQVDPAPAHQPAGGYGYPGYGGHQGYNYGGYGYGGLVCMCKTPITNGHGVICSRTAASSSPAQKQPGASAQCYKSGNTHML